MSQVDSLDELKRQAALKAAEYVRDGMVVGLGTGSTAKHMVIALGEQVRKGLRIRGVPTSRETADLARRHGITLIESVDEWVIDVAIDGADQVDPQLNLIKGGGGALLKEKIVAASAKQFIVVVDHTKQVPVLGNTVPLPIEVVPFGWGSTARQIEEVSGGKATLRMRDDQIFHTEAGHYIVDVHIAAITNPRDLEAQLNQIPGIVETGLFVGRTHLLLVAAPEGVESQSATRS
ncbi:MAG: ribose-5-phosphate isomerase RpiA [Nitrospirae bacterium]|nr:ribose-5-phosphate isomerase RpiA [Nitrospirota bacterium]